VAQSSFGQSHAFGRVAVERLVETKPTLRQRTVCVQIMCFAQFRQTRLDDSYHEIARVAAVIPSLIVAEIETVVP
jgi:hypothetical protein